MNRQLSSTWRNFQSVASRALKKNSYTSGNLSLPKPPPKMPDSSRPTPEFDRNVEQNALYAEFPHLFWKRSLPNSSMMYGLCIGPGWFPIIHELCLRMNRAIAQEDLNDPRARMWAFDQIKEKYGELRIYGPSDGEDGPISDARDWAEDEASKTCEDCGAEGSLLIKNGWYTTACQQCFNARE